MIFPPPPSIYIYIYIHVKKIWMEIQMNISNKKMMRERCAAADTFIISLLSAHTQHTHTHKTSTGVYSAGKGHVTPSRGCHPPHQLISIRGSIFRNQAHLIEPHQRKNYELTDCHVISPRGIQSKQIVEGAGRNASAPQRGSAIDDRWKNFHPLEFIDCRSGGSKITHSAPAGSNR